MKYQEQIQAFVNYFKKTEVHETKNKIGVEFEHFVLNSDLSAVSYYGENGVESLLKTLSEKKWDPVFENEHLIGLEKNNAIITLEPGAQLEISIRPCLKLSKIKKIYKDILEDLKSELKKRKQILAVLGYQPETSIADIELLPKKRYDYMYDYFSDKGKYAYNMMKGTASIHVNIDYVDENDYIKKMRSAYFLTPIIYYLFDNTPYFEGRESNKASIREKIWSNCDDQRSVLIDGVFDKNFGYSDYAEYLLNTPPIIAKKNGQLYYSRNKLLREVMDSGAEKDIEHYLGMVFPDVRSKKYIEIRAADAIPYPYNLGYTAMLEGLLYNQKNLNKIYNKSLKYNQQQFLEFRHNLINDKNNSKRNDLIEELILMADSALAENRKYLEYVKEIYFQHQKAKLKTLKSSTKSKKEALAWCILD
jgi:glutamate--cysteine ligase